MLFTFQSNCDDNAETNGNLCFPTKDKRYYYKTHTIYINHCGLEFGALVANANPVLQLQLEVFNPVMLSTSYTTPVSDFDTCTTQFAYASKLLISTHLLTNGMDVHVVISEILVSLCFSLIVEIIRTRLYKHYLLSQREN